MMFTVILAIIASLAIYRLFCAFDRPVKFAVFKQKPSFGNNMIDITSKADQKQTFPEVLAIFDDFDSKKFISMAEKLFDDVFMAFADSNHEFLGSRLSGVLYESFAAQISKRESMNLRQEIDIQHSKTEIEDVKVKNERAWITVIFEILQMSALMNSEGVSVDNPGKISRDIKHRWVLSRARTEQDWLVEKTSVW